MINNLLQYIRRVLIGFDQFCNSILGGYPDETISARLWRTRNQSILIDWCRVLVDTIFGNPNHCKNAYDWEISRGDLPRWYMQK